MDANVSMESQRWHIPRPSLASSGGDGRSRGGSASSQGSTSTHSTQSASSGSMLLSAANLASVQPRPSLAEVHRTRELRQPLQRPDYTLPIPEETKDTDRYWADVKRASEVAVDVASVVSSTHFTVVNGFTKHQPRKEPGCCCARSHQITVLVVCMTVLLSACVLAAICFVEMRIRRDAGIYKYS